MKQVIIAAVASMLVCGAVFAAETTTTTTTTLTALTPEQCEAAEKACDGKKECLDDLVGKGCTIKAAAH